MLGEQSNRMPWRSQQQSLKSVVRPDHSTSQNVFIHAGESSADEIIPKTTHGAGITKDLTTN